MKALRVCAGLALIASLVTGCGSGNSDGNGAGAKYTVAIVPAGPLNSGTASLRAAAIAEGKKYDMKVVWREPKVLSADEQVPVVQSLLAEKPDGLAISVAEGHALESPLQQFNDANIPIVGFDAVPTDAVKVVSDVTTDNKLLGKTAADELAKLLPQGGNVGVIDFDPSNLVLSARRQGFADEIAAKYPNIKVVDTQFTGPNDPLGRATAIAQTYLNKYKDLNAILPTSISLTRGAAAAVDNAAAHDRVKVVGFEGSVENQQLLRDKKLDVAIAQDLRGMGRAIIDQLYYKLSGDDSKVQKTVNLPGFVLTPDNVDSAEAKKYEDQALPGS